MNKRTRILLCAVAAVLAVIGLTHRDGVKPGHGQTLVTQTNRADSAAATPDSAHPAAAELAALGLEVGGIGVRATRRGENAKQGGAQ